MIEREPGTDWKDLQRRVATILGECGIHSEVARTLQTARGRVEVDVYGTDPTTTPPAIYVCECKRWRTPVPQGEVLTFRTVVSDAGAHYGLMISASGFQAGGHEVVRHTNLHLLNWVEFQEMFVERWVKTYWVPTFRDRADRLASHAEPVNSDATVRHSHGGRLEPEEAIGLMALDMWGDPFVDSLIRLPDRPTKPLTPAIWKLRNSYKEFLPESVRESMHLRDLLDSLSAFAVEWLRRTGRT